MTELDATERVGISHELPTCDELGFPVHLTLNLIPFHLSSLLELLHSSLIGETLLIDTVDGIAHKMIVLSDQHRFLWHKRQERHLVFNCHQLRYNFYLVSLFLRQLIFYLEGSDAIDVLAEEINTIRVFATKGIDVEDGAAQGKLTWLIDIFNLAETELT